MNTGSSKRKPSLRVYGNKQKRRQASEWSLFVDEKDTTSNDKMASFPYSSLTPDPWETRKRPSSQKEASIPAEPDAAVVNMVVDFTGCTKDLAIRFLKVKNHNAEAAVNGIFENEDINALEQGSTWDESMFSVDRNGNEASLYPLGVSPAPTRGPSPTPSLGLSQPKSKSEEDKELEAAIARSRQDWDVPVQQETGVRQQDGTETRQKFGPATREHYESAQWAMVPSTATVAHEIVPDVDVEQRRHVAGEPRFLKHLPDGDYTPNFIAICHAIPAAREAFLLRDSIRTDYGQDADWWRGHSIPIPRIVHTIDGSIAEPESYKQEELIAETQRLMAFLDSSTRSYATIGALTQTEAIKSSEAGASRSGTLLELFISNWTGAAQAQSQFADDIARFFSTKVGTTSPEGMATPDLRLVDLSVGTEDGEKVDLSELLDNMLWDTDTVNYAFDNYIERPAEVIVMRLSHTRPASSQLGVQVPAALNLEKYLHENIAATRSIRERMAQGKKRVLKLEEIERKLNVWQHPKKSTKIEARQLLQHSLGHFSGQNRRHANQADYTNNASIDDTQLPHYADITKQLEQVIASIDSKLVLLAQEKEKTRKAVSELSRATLSEQTAGGTACRYTLRGVATKPNITYVLRPKDDKDEEEADMLLQPSEDGTPPDMQWWRIDYEVSGATAKVTKSKAADYDVLRAVELEHNSALLVYASDRASSPDQCEPLPEPLQQFCRRDDRLFAAELRAEHNRHPPPAYDYPDIPRQSIEERTSIDSTRVETGDLSSSPTAATAAAVSSPTSLLEPPGYNDEGFDAHPNFGLGYDIKPLVPAASHAAADPPVAEIKLSPVRDDEDAEDLLGDPTGREVETVEKAHKPLLPTHADAAMSGMESQDFGVGGAAANDVNMK